MATLKTQGDVRGLYANEFISCRKCGRFKPASFFLSDTKSGGGHVCIDCIKTITSRRGTRYKCEICGEWLGNTKFKTRRVWLGGHKVCGDCVDKLDRLYPTIHHYITKGVEEPTTPVIEFKPKLETIIDIDRVQVKKIKSDTLVGYVYLLCSSTGYYKIGMSNNPERRLNDLTSGLPPGVDISIIHTIKCTNMRTMESELHHAFRTKRVNGEWFDLDEADIDYITAIDTDGALTVDKA